MDHIRILTEKLRNAPTDPDAEKHVRYMLEGCAKRAPMHVIIALVEKGTVA